MTYLYIQCALLDLNDLILKENWEFPEALDRVCKLYVLDAEDRQTLVELYDNEP